MPEGPLRPKAHPGVDLDGQGRGQTEVRSEGAAGPR